MRIEKLMPRETGQTIYAPLIFAGETLVIDPEATKDRRMQLVQVFATEEGSPRIVVRGV